MQNDLFDVLIRFQRYIVALSCDDMACHQFLWRDMSMKQKPEEYEFNHLEFGINSSPFLAQFVSQFHAKCYEQSFLEQKSS